MTVSYLWNRGMNLFTVRDVNLGNAGAPITYTLQDAAGNTASTWTTPVYLLANRVDPRYRGLNMVENGGDSWYNGLALQLRKRISHGLQASVSYTWSHAIDNANQGGASDSLFVSQPRSTYPGDYAGDRGSSTLDQRHRAVVNFLWTPKLTDSNSVFARYLINGWQLSTITTMASSHPTAATVNISSAVSGVAWTTLNGSGGANRVPFWSVNPIDVDQQFRVDAAFSASFPLRSG